MKKSQLIPIVKNSACADHRTNEIYRFFNEHGYYLARESGKTAAKARENVPAEGIGDVVSGGAP
ncbi:MAG: hypothetical protein HY360_18195 [Verrucomicrobia bacterium]|nr:hypothetical protein [Verrucomicrobiota bacterium]